MTQIEEILRALKANLKAQGLTYKTLAKELSLSEASVKRLLANGQLTLPRLQKICELAKVSIYDVTRMAQSIDDALPRQLTSEQEEYLAARPKLFTYFYLLLRQWKPAQIRKAYNFSDSESERCLLDLDKIRLIELHPGGRVKQLCSPNLTWSAGGPIHKMYESAVKADFLRHDFDSRNDRLKFLQWELSDATAKLMQRRIDRFVKELEELAASDEALTKSDTESHAFLVGIRPWVFSVMAKYKR